MAQRICADLRKARRGACRTIAWRGGKNELRPRFRGKSLGSPRFPLKGSFKGDIDIGIDINVDLDSNTEADMDIWLFL